MKLNKYLVLTCGAVLVSSLILQSNNHLNNSRQTLADERPSYLDTKEKSADAQFESKVGTFTELPLFNTNNEKIKNILYSNTTRENINKENLMEVRDIVLESGYKYDEVIIELEDNYCLKYNPFTNKISYGTLGDDFKLNIIKTASL